MQVKRDYASRFVDADMLIGAMLEVYIVTWNSQL